MPSLSLLLKQANHLYKCLTVYRAQCLRLVSCGTSITGELTPPQAIQVVLALAESSMHLSSWLHSLVLSGGYEGRLLLKTGFYLHEHVDARSFCTRTGFSGT